MISRPIWCHLVTVILLLLALVTSFLTVSAWLGSGRAGKTWTGLYRVHAMVVPLGSQAWIAPYNEGTGFLMRDDYQAGERPLRVALDTVPEASKNKSGSIVGSNECRVRMNLSLVLEGQGRAAREAKKTVEGRQLLEKAADVSKPCTTDGKGGEQTNSPQDRIHKRQRDTAKPAQQDSKNSEPNSPEQPKPDPSPTPSDSPSSSSSPAPTPEPKPSLDPKQQKLAESQRQAEAEVREENERKGKGYGTHEAW